MDLPHHSQKAKPAKSDVHPYSGPDHEDIKLRTFALTRQHAYDHGIRAKHVVHLSSRPTPIPDKARMLEINPARNHPAQKTTWRRGVGAQSGNRATVHPRDGTTNIVTAKVNRAFNTSKIAMVRVDGVTNWQSTMATRCSRALSRTAYSVWSTESSNVGSAGEKKQATISGLLSMVATWCVEAVSVWRNLANSGV